MLYCSNCYKCSGLGIRMNASTSKHGESLIHWKRALCRLEIIGWTSVQKEIAALSGNFPIFQELWNYCSLTGAKKTHSGSQGFIGTLSTSNALCPHSGSLGFKFLMSYVETLILFNLGLKFQAPLQGVLKCLQLDLQCFLLNSLGKC